MRLDPEGSRFRISPHSVPPEFFPVPGERGFAPRNWDSSRGTCPRRPELDGNSAGTHRGLASPPHEAGQTVPRRQSWPAPWHSGSKSGPSPIQRRATASVRDSLEGGESGESSGRASQERVCDFGGPRGDGRETPWRQVGLSIARRVCTEREGTVILQRPEGEISARPGAQ